MSGRVSNLQFELSIPAQLSISDNMSTSSFVLASIRTGNSVPCKERKIPDTTTGSTSVAFLKKKKTQQMHAVDKKRMDFAVVPPHHRYSIHFF
jgi:hypothetical protein